MEHLTLRKPDLVVAIDVGSTYSGYAWQWRSDFEKNRSNVEFNTDWGAGALQLHVDWFNEFDELLFLLPFLFQQLHKTKTCILLNKNQEVDSFGHQAEKRFCNENARIPDETVKNWYYFKRFKLLLYADKFKDNILVDDYNGRTLSFDEVMTKFIRAIREHFLKNKLPQDVDKDKILWVITVPQIWSDAAKSFMRRCAEQSGIKKKRLLLAMEPEAAALYCIHLPSEERKSMNNLGHVGDRFLTADLGGGTADISTVEVSTEGFLNELCSGSGDLVGGQNINDAFFQACVDILEGGSWYDSFNEKNAEDLLNLEDDFEKIKLSNATSKEVDEYIQLKIPLDMQMKLRAGTLFLKNTEVASNYFNSQKGKFQFSSKYVREILFEETVKRVIKTIIENLKLKNASGIRTVILVGGFAQSPIVVEGVKAEIQKEFPSVQVFVPTSPFRAVLHGAVLFGHDPFIFRSRVSRQTYGIRTNRLFDESVHAEAKRWTNKDDCKDYCKDIFGIHVRRDQTVVLRERQPTKEYSPMHFGQKQMSLPIFASTMKDPKYTTDEGCKQIGEIKVDMPDTTGELSRNVEVTMIYGGTELAVKATDVNTAMDFEANIKFETT